MGPAMTAARSARIKVTLSWWQSRRRELTRLGRAVASALAQEPVARAVGLTGSADAGPGAAYGRLAARLG
jgi:hypothetical protein